MNPGIVGWTLGVLYACALILAALGVGVAWYAVAFFVLIAYGVALYARHRAAKELALLGEALGAPPRSRPYDRVTRDFITLR